MPAGRQAYPSAARKRANEVIDELGITGVPIIPESIAAKRNLRVETSASFPPTAFGALVKNGNQFTIVVSAHCPSDGHRRFTLAHELGHFFLNDHFAALFENSTIHVSNEANFRGRKQWFEVEADAFASELLVPTRYARGIVEGLDVGVDGIRTLGGAFQTSLSCAAIRFAALTHEPMAAILSYKGTVEWIAFSGSLEVHEWVRRRWKGEWAPPRSATARLASSTEEITRGAQLSDSGMLSEWFLGAPNSDVTEEAMGLGRYGRVLTVLWCPDLPSPDEQLEQEEAARRPPTDWRDSMRTYRFDDY